MLVGWNGHIGFMERLQLEQRAAILGYGGSDVIGRLVRSNGRSRYRASLTYAFPEPALECGETLHQVCALGLERRVLRHLMVAGGLPHRIAQEPELAQERSILFLLRQSGDDVVRQTEREVRGRRAPRPPDVVEDAVQHSRLGLGVRRDGGLQLVLHVSLLVAHRAPLNETTPCKRMGSTREQAVPAL